MEEEDLSDFSHFLHLYEPVDEDEEDEDEVDVVIDHNARAPPKKAILVYPRYGARVSGGLNDIDDDWHFTQWREICAAGGFGIEIPHQSTVSLRYIQNAVVDSSTGSNSESVLVVAFCGDGSTRGFHLHNGEIVDDDAIQSIVTSASGFRGTLILILAGGGSVLRACIKLPGPTAESLFCTRAVTSTISCRRCGRRSTKTWCLVLLTPTSSTCYTISDRRARHLQPHSAPIRAASEGPSWNLRSSYHGW